MSSNHSNKERPEDRGPGLYLERTPSSGSEREIDEVVPEFMHRAFYRSTDDEYQAVEPAQLLRSKRRTKFVERTPEPAPAPVESEAAEPVAGAPAPLRSPEPPRAQEPLSPLRSPAGESEEYNEDTVAVPLRTLPQPPQSPPPANGSWPPPAPKSTGINYPIVICLLAVIGLFIWREQTRPPIPAQEPLPVPTVQVTERQPEPAAALGEESPYPEMSPEVAAPTEETETVVTAETQEGELVDPERATTLAEEKEEESTTYPSREASAQRAAILERMSDGTVSNMERASREPAQPAQDTSLFPATEQAASKPPAQPWTVPESPTKKPPETAKAAESGSPPSESLFPVEAKTAVQKPVTTQPVATKPPAAQKPPVKANPPAQPVQGEPYQIAEPTF